MKIKVTISREYEFEDEDLSEEFVDIKGLAEDIIRSEVDKELSHKDLVADDFIFKTEVVD